jgi:hypothetical protein
VLILGAGIAGMASGAGAGDIDDIHIHETDERTFVKIVL